MKLMNIGLSAVLAATALAMTAPVALADCDNYGNQVNVGSNYDCQVNYNICDGEAGWAASGAGGGAGGGSKTDTGASAGTSSACGQCAGAGCAPPGMGADNRDPSAFVEWASAGLQFECSASVFSRMAVDPEFAFVAQPYVVQYILGDFHALDRFCEE